MSTLLAGAGAVSSGRLRRKKGGSSSATLDVGNVDVGPGHSELRREQMQEKGQRNVGADAGGHDECKKGKLQAIRPRDRTPTHKVPVLLETVDQAHLIPFS